MTLAAMLRPPIYNRPVKPSRRLQIGRHVFVGNGAAFEANKEIRIADFTDGTDKTILIVGLPEFWASSRRPSRFPGQSPRSLPTIQRSPCPSWADYSRTAAFFDSEVRFITRDTDEKLILAMITLNSGEPIDKLPP